jgi:hypothetical protein
MGHVQYHIPGIYVAAIAIKGRVARDEEQSSLKRGAAGCGRWKGFVTS